MGALDAFNAMWGQTRATFGDGVPVDGTGYDKSAQFRELQSQTQSAAPGSHWTGSASDAYADANDVHARKFGRMAELDQKMCVEITRSADAVLAGRRQLDAVRQWVNDVATGLPKTAVGDAQLFSAVSKGSSEISDIIPRTHNEMASIAGRVNILKAGWDELGGDPKERGPGDKDGIDKLTGDKDDDARRRAEKDVHDALAGDQKAAKRVGDVLNTIKPGQPLSPEQGSYLSQMQAQQNGMSIKDLKTAEQRLGDQKGIIANSWQLMSNDKVQFPKTPLHTGDLDNPNDMTKGGFNNLPQSVQTAIKSSGAEYIDQMRDISGIVKDGSPALQVGTGLDREMLGKADRIMDTPIWEHDPASVKGEGERDPWIDPAVSSIFESAGRDHVALSDLVTSDRGNDFIHDITTHAWQDKGAAAGSLFSWTNEEANGPNAEIATKTAHAYANYVGVHGGELLNLPGHHSLGEMDPKLVQSMAHGLLPYQSDMVGDNKHGFEPLDQLGSNLHNTRSLFAVMDSNPEAAKEFNAHAYKTAMDYENSFAEAAKIDPNITGTNPHRADLDRAGRLIGLVDAGVFIEVQQHGTNTQASAFDRAHDAWEMKKLAWDVVGENVPGFDRAHSAFQDGVIGKEPKIDNFPGDYSTPDIDVRSGNQGLGNASTQVAYTVAAQLVHAPNADIGPEYFTGNGSGVLMTPAEVRAKYGESGWSDYSAALERYFANQQHSLDSSITNFGKNYHAPLDQIPPARK